jgi:hypothetical protein
MRSRENDNAISIAENKVVCSMLIAYLRLCGSRETYSADKVIVLSGSCQNDSVFGKSCSSFPALIVVPPCKT